MLAGGARTFLVAPRRLLYNQVAIRDAARERTLLPLFCLPIPRGARAMFIYVLALARVCWPRKSVRSRRRRHGHGEEEGDW